MFVFGLSLSLLISHPKAKVSMLCDVTKQKMNWTVRGSEYLLRPPFFSSPLSVAISGTLETIS
jgi:hypothetical protein